MKEFINSLEEMSDNFQDWIIENQSNPLLWMGFLVLGLAVFFITYSALQKEKS